jgi:hypothetical protein
MNADVPSNISEALQLDQDGGRLAPAVECISYSPLGAALVTGRSRSRIFLAIKNGELIARKDGRATLVEAAELRRWIRSLPTIGHGRPAA